MKKVGKVTNGQLTNADETTDVNMTTECWIVQMHGIDACEPCPAKDTQDCNGQRIRTTGENLKGRKVPVT
jgi:hypothetical protein